MKTYCSYPAVLQYDTNGISVFFPDFQGCMTCADNDNEVYDMALDALEGWLELMQTEGKKFPEPSALSEIKAALKDNQATTLVRVNLAKIRAKNENKAVNKMVTLPQWVITAGKDAGLNFSQVLKEAVIEKLALAR